MHIKMIPIKSIFLYQDLIFGLRIYNVIEITIVSYYFLCKNSKSYWSLSATLVEPIVSKTLHYCNPTDLQSVSSSGEELLLQGGRVWTWTFYHWDYYVFPSCPPLVSVTTSGLPIPHLLNLALAEQVLWTSHFSTIYNTVCQSELHN